MLVVLHIPSAHYVYREDPEFEPGLGVKNAVLFGDWDKRDLAEVNITEQEWEEDLAKQREEEPPTEVDLLKEEIEALKARVSAIETP